MSHRQKHPQNNQFTNHTTVKVRAKEKARVREKEKAKAKVRARVKEKEKEVTHITMITTAKEREVRTAMEKVKGKVATIMVTIIQEKVE